MHQLYMFYYIDYHDCLRKVMCIFTNKEIVCLEILFYYKVHIIIYYWYMYW